MTLAWPVEPVVVTGWDRLPQAALGLPDVENDTRSPDTAAPPGPLTVAVTVEVAEPFPGRLAGEAVTATVLAGAAGRWVIMVVPDEAVADSVAVIVQNPRVVDAV